MYIPSYKIEMFWRAFNDNKEYTYTDSEQTAIRIASGVQQTYEVVRIWCKGAIIWTNQGGYVKR